MSRRRRRRAGLPRGEGVSLVLELFELIAGVVKVVVSLPMLRLRIFD